MTVAAAAAKSLQSCPTLCDPIDGSPPGFPVPGILQARTLEWVAISFSNAGKWKVKVKSLSRSSRPHALQPTRLLRPWDFPGKNTEWGVKRRDLDTDMRTQEECHVNIKAEMRWCSYKPRDTKKCQQTTRNHRRDLEQTFPDSSQKESPRPYLISNILPPELWNNIFLLLNYSVCSTLLQEPSKLKHSFYYFIFSTYFWLPWVFVAVCGLSLVAESGGCTRVSALQLLIAVASLLVEHSSRAGGLR